MKSFYKKKYNIIYKGDNFISNMKSCGFKRIKAGTLAKLLEVTIIIKVIKYKV